MKQSVIREIRSEEIPLLNDFLYEAIFIPEGVPAPPRSIIENEDLQVYVRDFGTGHERLRPYRRWHPVIGHLPL